MKIQNKILSIMTLITGISNVNAKTSSNILRDQQPKIKEVISKCQFSDTKVLEEIKGLATGAAVTSAIATTGSVVSTATSSVAAYKAKDDIKVGSKKELLGAKDKNKELKNLRLTSLIGAGVATGANLATLSLSVASTKNLKKLITETDDCMKAIEDVNLEAIKE